jgi:hypothetical protein
MRYAPIVIPTLNRYEHLVRCVESLKDNTHAENTELIVGLDYPPAKKYEDGHRRIEEYLTQLSGFKAVTVIKRSKNLGAIENIKALLATVFEKTDALIFSEDDNVFAPNFLDYVNKGLELYENDKTIASISGYSYPVEMPESNTTVVKMQRYFSDWGFGVWKDRYHKIKNTLDNAYIRSILTERSKANILCTKSRKNFVYAVRLLQRHDIRPMDYTSSIFQTVNNLYSIMPKISLVRNEGFDDSGVHCNLKDPQNVILKKLFTDQKLDSRREFPKFVIDEKETEPTNERINASAIGNYDKTAFAKAKLKVLFLRIGILDAMYGIKKRLKTI